jgi:hypothetical protein
MMTVTDTLRTDTEPEVAHHTGQIVEEIETDLERRIARMATELMAMEMQEDQVLMDVET